MMLLNEQGDTTVSWTPDLDDEMEKIIARKMSLGVTFFIVEREGRPTLGRTNARSQTPRDRRRRPKLGSSARC